MKKSYEVFSINNQPTSVRAELPGGIMVDASVDSLEVQLTAMDGKSGTIKMVFTDPTEIESAKLGLVVGQEVEMYFA